MYEAGMGGESLLGEQDEFMLISRYTWCLDSARKNLRSTEIKNVKAKKV